MSHAFKGVKKVARAISGKVTPLWAGKSLRGCPVRLALRLWISLLLIS